jgi:hypothetical protein
LKDKPNFIQVKLTASEQLQKTDASYVKSYFVYDDGEGNTYENHFNIKDKQITFLHNLKKTDVAGIKNREISFVLKKKGMFGFRKTVLDKAYVKLTLCGSKATWEKTVALGGAKMTVEIMTYKSFGKKDMQDTVSLKWALGPVIPAYEKKNQPKPAP